MSTPKIITLDADGVLLDYSSAYAKAWERYSGLAPMEHQPYAYWPMERWGVPRLEGQDLVAFRRQFDEAFWGALPAIPGALQACQLLVQHGYELVCVTALDERFGQARRHNLQSLGFPIKRVITTSMDAPQGSPKAPVMRALQPAAFVDDFAPYFDGVAPGIHKALVMRDPYGSPNTPEIVELADSSHPDLLGFARWWVEHQRG